MLSPSTIWKRLLSVAHRVGFTQNEAGVIVFLAVVLLAGGTIEAFRSDQPQAYRHRDVRQALARQDSAFAERSLQTTVTQVSTSISEKLSTDQTSVASDPSGISTSIDINHATEKELEALPGIGPATAKKIVDYRTLHGSFLRIEDIMRVKSIGPKKFENIRQFITLE